MHVYYSIWDVSIREQLASARESLNDMHVAVINILLLLETYPPYFYLKYNLKKYRILKLLYTIISIMHYAL